MRRSLIIPLAFFAAACSSDPGGKGENAGNPNDVANSASDAGPTDGATSGDKGITDDAATSPGLTVHVGPPTNSRSVYLFLGDGQTHFEVVHENADTDDFAVVRFPDVDLPQDVTVVYQSRSYGPDNQPRTADDPQHYYFTTLVRVDVPEIWVGRYGYFIEPFEPYGPLDETTVTGAFVSPDVEGRVIPVRSQTVFDHYDPDAAGRLFRLELDGEFPSNVDLVAQGKLEDGSIAFGTLQDVAVEPDTINDVGELSLDILSDQTLTVQGVNGLEYGGTYGVSLLFQARLDQAPELIRIFTSPRKMTFPHFLEQDWSEEQPFTGTFSTPSFSSAPLGELAVRKVRALAGEYFDSSDYEQMDPDIPFGRVTQTVPSDADTSEFRYLEPLVLTSPPLGTWDEPGEIGQQAFEVSWTPDNEATTFSIEIDGFDGDAPTQFEWLVVTPMELGQYTLPPVPTEIHEPGALPSGLYQVRARKTCSGSCTESEHHLGAGSGDGKTAELWGFLSIP